MDIAFKICEGNAQFGFLRLLPSINRQCYGVTREQFGFLPMNGEDNDTEEPQSAGADSAVGQIPQAKKSRRSFGQVRRELTEEELGASGVQKMLLDELDRLEGVEADLKSISVKYYEFSAELQVANEKLRTHKAFDILSTGAVAVGSLLAGASFNWKDNGELFWWLIIISGILMLIGIIAKVIRA